MGRGGKLESKRPGGARGGKAAVTYEHSLCRQHALLRLLVTKRNGGFLSPCLGWCRNPRLVQKPQTSCRLLTSSAESYRSFVDRHGGKCANGVGKCCFGCAHLHGSIPYRPSTSRRVSLSRKPLRKDCLSSAAPGSG